MPMTTKNDLILFFVLLFFWIFSQHQSKHFLLTYRYTFIAKYRRLSKTEGRIVIIMMMMIMIMKKKHQDSKGMLLLVLALLLVTLLLSFNNVVMVYGSQMTIGLHGSGTTNPSRCYWSILETIKEQSILPIHATYRGIGSTNGIMEFLYPITITGNQSITDVQYPLYFASGDIPITTELYNTIDNNTTSIVHIPVVAGTVSFFHSVPNVTNINLTACILSQIYTQQITTWNDEQILDINPELNLIDTSTLPPITVIVRSEGSSSTHAATNYMHSACLDESLALSSTLTGELPSWPTLTAAAPTDGTEDTRSFRNCSGSAGVTTCLVEKPGSIGYIDTGHGLDANLYEVRLRTLTSDTYFHSLQGAPIANAISPALLPSDPTDDFGNVTFLNAAAKADDTDNTNTWPLILMTYIYVRTDIGSYITDPVEQSLLIAFLRTFFNKDYINVCKDLYGFTIMNDIEDMKVYGEKAIDLIEQGLTATAPKWTFESKTAVVGGVAPYVLSNKRKEIIDVTVKDLTTAVSDIEMTLEGIVGDESDINNVDSDSQSKIILLEMEVQKLTSELNTLREKVEGNSGGSSSNSLNTNGDDSNQQIKAALVLSSLSFVFWCLWFLSYVLRFMNGTSMNKNTRSTTSLELSA